MGTIFTIVEFVYNKNYQSSIKMKLLSFYMDDHVETFELGSLEDRVLVGMKVI
jgi:hypothetical protein